MRSAARLVILALLGFFLALPAPSVASAAPAADDVADDVVVTTTKPTAKPPTSSSAPPAGTIGKLNPKQKAQQDAEDAEQHRKLIMGVASVVLLAIVIWGRSVRRKRRKATEG